LYSFGNPTTFVDPDGREPITIGTILLLGALGAEIGFFTDVVAQEVEAGGGGGTAGFFRNHFDAGRSAISTAVGAISGLFGGGLAAGGASTLTAAGSGILFDSTLDTGAEYLQTEDKESFNTRESLGRNTLLNTLFLGAGKAGGDLLDASKKHLGDAYGGVKRFFGAADDVADTTSTALTRVRMAETG
jgi:hypothetical protein